MSPVRHGEAGVADLGVGLGQNDEVGVGGVCLPYVSTFVGVEDLGLLEEVLLVAVATYHAQVALVDAVRDGSPEAVLELL